MASKRKTARKRRGRGEGGVYFHEGKGLWVAQVSGGYDEFGKRLRLYRYGKSKADVLAVVGHLDGTTHKGNSPRLDRFLRTWLDGKRRTVKPNTVRFYEQMVDGWLTPTLGDFALSNIDEASIRMLHKAMIKAKLGNRMAESVHITLRAALNDAVRQKLIPSNPCTFVPPPRYDKPEMKYLSIEQAKTFVSVARRDRLAALYILAIFSGMREGEIFGLQHEDFDPKAKTIAVRRQQTDIGGEIGLAEPKRSSRRTILLPQVVVDALVLHRKKCGNIDPNERIFTADNGEPLRAWSFLKFSFYPLLEKANLPKITFHGLRHSAATIATALGTNPKVLQEQLGHADVMTTLKMYTHVAPTMQKEAAAAIDRAFRTKKRR